MVCGKNTWEVTKSTQKVKNYRIKVIFSLDFFGF